MLERLLQEKRFQDRIQLFADVLEKDWSSELDAVFEGADEVGVCKFDDVEVVRLLLVLDPLVGLSLGVNHQGPTTSIAIYGGKKI